MSGVPCPSVSGFIWTQWQTPDRVIVQFWGGMWCDITAHWLDDLRAADRAEGGAGQVGCTNMSVPVLCRFTTNILNLWTFCLNYAHKVFIHIKRRVVGCFVDIIHRFPLRLKNHNVLILLTKLGGGGWGWLHKNACRSLIQECVSVSSVWSSGLNETILDVSVRSNAAMAPSAAGNMS